MPQDHFDLNDTSPAATMAAMIAEAAKRAELEQDDEEKRRAGRAAGDAGGPALAALGFNIRPDVVSAPAGLETITTQKSADYRAGLQDDATRRAAEPDTAGESPYRVVIAQSILTELIVKAKDQDAAEDAAYLAYQPPIPVPATLAENQWLSPEAEVIDVNPVLARAEPRAGEQPPALTLEAIADDRWNAVELALPKDADASLLKAAHSGAEYRAEGECGLMLDALMGAAPNSDAHEESAARWLQAESRLELIEDRQAALEAAREAAPSLQMPDNDAEREDATRRAESAARQESERRINAGEAPSNDLALSATPDFAADLRAASKAAEREAESEAREGASREERGEGRSSEGYSSGGGRSR